MSLSGRLLCPAICFTILFSTGTGRGAVTVARSNPDDGLANPSIAVVAGRPAMAWTDYESHTIKYARAANATGTAWEPAITVRNSPFNFPRVVLRTVNGNPAICYSDTADQSLVFIRAADATGSSWGPPVVIVPGGSLGFTMEIVNGNPAVLYSSSSLGFIRASDPNGSAWGPSTTVDLTGSPPASLNLAVVQGFPAAAFVTRDGVWYRRASNATGTAWAPRVNLSTQEDYSIFENNASLQVVDGMPSVAFSERFPSALKYVRASDATGTAWGTPVLIESAEAECSLAVVNGRPAIGYKLWDSAADLKFVQATNSTGATAAVWGPRIAVDSIGSVGRSATLLEVSGRPALAYSDLTRGSVKFVRALDTPAGQWPADAVVTGADGKDTLDGEALNFGVVAAGSTPEVILNLRNPNSGSAPLTIQSVTITGPDAAAFSIPSPPALTTLTAGSGTPFTVRYTAIAPGVRSAVLRIVSNADGDSNPYEINLAAVTGPDLLVELPEQPAGTSVADGATVRLPMTDPGKTIGRIFNVRNPGGTDLSGLAVTVDGPDSGAFSVTAPPAAVVPAGGSTSFTVSHTPHTPGSKNAVLHLASNINGSKNPFDIVLTTQPGVADLTFQPGVSLPAAQAVALQADEKILMATVDGISRLHANGTRDAAFLPPAPGGTVSCLAVQYDGRILAGGDFISFGGVPHKGIVRLNADGSLDNSFTSFLTNPVSCIALQPDGKILAGSDLEGATHQIIRLHPDGSPDAAFTATPGAPVVCLALQPDGKILYGGAWALGRLFQGGATDFASPEFTRCLALQIDRRFLTGNHIGDGIVRHQPTGTRDSSLPFVALGSVDALVLQADGNCIAAGDNLQTFGPVRVNGACRFGPTGAVDATFDPKLQTTGLAGVKVALQADGKVILTGEIYTVDGVQTSFTRLANDPATSALIFEGRTAVRWMRGGTAPEVSDVRFESKADGSPGWTLLGTGGRISGGWRLEGLTLPSSGTVRALGRAGGSVMASVASIPSPAPLDSWRLQFFNTTDNTGDAADDADPDNDGLTNFAEFAFGLSPVDRESNALPEFKHSGASFTVSFTPPGGREDVIYAAEWSLSMQPGSWTELKDTGAGITHHFSLSGAGKSAFVRFIVRMQ